ncbi:MAG: MFS transporter [Thermoanaerobaculia bacterium]
MSALRILIYFGFVSLFGDMTYEGARSITGPFLKTLGASAFLVGFVSGLGEFVGYGLRILSGYISDKAKLWWQLTIAGYALNILVIPLLGLTKSLEIAIILILLERLGKAVRTPSRDTILSLVTKKMGEGKGFGIHEAMDQIGALLGPLVVSLIFFLKGSYRESFLALGIPAIFCLIFLWLAKKETKLEEYIQEQKEREDSPNKFFWYYLLFISFSVLGFVHFQVISYHFAKIDLFSLKYIPLLFAIAMGIDAFSALFSGFLFDRKGFSILLSVPFMSIVSIPLIFSSSKFLAFFGILLWGIILGMQESIMRAGISKLAPVKKRGFSYGIFNSLYGLSFFIGSALMGYLYDLKPLFLVLFSIFFNILSLFLFLKFKIYKLGR